jgi:hypothetical protein
MTLPWPIIMPILNVIWSACSPALRAAALAELKTLEVADAAQPVLEFIIKEAEVLVAAA